MIGINRHNRVCKQPHTNNLPICKSINAIHIDQIGKTQEEMTEELNYSQLMISHKLKHYRPKYEIFTGCDY